MITSSRSRQTSGKTLVSIPIKQECRTQLVEGLAKGHENAVFGLDRSWMRWKMTASSSEFAVAQTLSEVASNREVPMTAIEETLDSPFSDPFRPPDRIGGNRYLNSCG